MNKINWIRIFHLMGFIGFSTLYVQCTDIPSEIPDHEVAAKWADMTLFVTQHTPANSPTFASRCLGYLGLAQYESVVHGYREYQSLAGQLNGLNELPLP
ncbi:MAG: hypothetical protein VW080_06130, partial [Flavobacteriaceae bacterium]